MNKKVIIQGGISRRLLTRGHILVDVKPKKEDNGTCFIFYQDKYFAKDLDNIMNHKGNDTTEMQKRLKTLNVTEKQYKADIFKEYLSNI